MGSQSIVEAAASSADAFRMLIAGVRAAYPLVSSARAAEPYLTGGLHHVAFEAKPHTQPRGITKGVLAEALKRAADSGDVAYAIHGARKHTTYEEALHLLSEALAMGELSLRSQAVFPITQDGRQIPSQRILAVAPEMSRISYVPQLRLAAEEALQQARTGLKSRDMLYRALRETAKQAGIGPALIQGIYQDMHPSELEKVFADSLVRKQLTGDPAVVPHPGMTTDQRKKFYEVAAQVNEALTVRDNGRTQTRKDPGAHNRALEILGANGWLRSHEEIREVIGFEPAERRVVPLAVFLTPHEVAARRATADHLEPYLSNALDRTFGDQMTTQVITSFLKH